MKDFIKQVKFWDACMTFRRKRHIFYRDLGNYMQAVGGTKKVIDILQVYADRHAGKAIGTVCAYWVERLPHVGTFTAAVRGTVPDDDLAVIAVSESAGDLSVGLLNLANTLDSIVLTKKEIQNAFGIVIAAFVVLHIFLGVEAFKALPQIEKPITRLVDIHRFSGEVQFLFSGGAWIRKWWWGWFIFIGAFFGLVYWSMPRLTGRFRRWLDDWILPYQLWRMHESSKLFATVGALTDHIGGRVMMLREALVQIQENATPWLAWQLSSIIDKHDQNPNAGGAMFDTGIVDRNTYYRILDISDYSAPNVVFKNIAAMLLKDAPEMAKSKGNLWRFISIVVILSVCLTVFGITYGMSDEFDSLIRLRFAR